MKNKRKYINKCRFRYILYGGGDQWENGVEKKNEFLIITYYGTLRGELYKLEVIFLLICTLLAKRGEIDIRTFNYWIYNSKISLVVVGHLVY